MAVKKFYAVKVGRKTGIFDSWGKCYNQVNGYPGAIYKGFADLDDAKSYLNPETSINDNESNLDAQMSVNKINNVIKQKELSENSNNIVDIYVDGSYNNEYNNYSYAYIIVKNNKIIYERNGIGTNSEACSIRNVAGELTATMRAVKYCKSNLLKCKIHHDYLGIAAWINGEWKAKNDIVRQYINTMNSLNYKDIVIKFEHVKGHSGNKFNERADKLCTEAFKQQVGINQQSIF